MNKISLSKLVAGGPMLLLLLVVLTLGASRYQNDYNESVKHELELARVGVQPVLNIMKASVGGGNYANTQDTEAMKLYRANARLEFFSVQGKTDLNNEDFGLIYDAGSNAVIRSRYPASHETDLNDKLQSARERLSAMDKSDSKYSRIEEIAKGYQASLDNSRRDIERSRELDKRYNRPQASQLSDGYWLDKKNWQLHLVLPTGNDAGGEIWLVINAAHIGEMWKHVLWKVAPLSLIALLISMVAAWLLARYITRSINSIHGSITTAERNSDLRQQIKIDSSNELGMIATAFNNMMHNFRNIISEVSKASSSLTDAAGQLSSNSDRTAREIASQQQGIQDVANSLSQLDSTVQEVSNSAAGASRAAEEANDQARKGSVMVHETISAIEGLVSEMDASGQIITKLGKDVHEISAVLDVIKSIAEQTNLLALNAAIEAARAGEHGRGFAVVAGEVRNLAARTQNAVSEIHLMISTLQNSAGEAVHAMKNGRNHVHHTRELAIRAGESLESITGMAQTILEMNQRIASATEEQSHVSEGVNHSVASIKHVAARTGETAENSERIALLARQLQDMVNRFHV